MSVFLNVSYINFMMFDEIFNKLLLVTIKEDQKISFVCFFKKRELFSFIFVKFHYLLMLFSLKKSINFKENIFKENRIKPVTYEISKTKSPIIFFTISNQRSMYSPDDIEAYSNVFQSDNRHKTQLLNVVNFTFFK